jgi:type VI secretion system secreted protein VgrG
VQFHWDREGTFSDASSCWMRVSQGWAGGGYGMIAVPRVGHEVLVAFLEGDPDNPIVVGRVYNATSRVPWDLPAHRTRSGWRTDSSPGSGGFNEIMFEDAKGHELVRVQAEKDLEKVVKHNEGISVGVDRRSSIGAVDESHVGVRHNVTMKHAGDGAPTFFEMVDKRIHFSTGEASITLDGPNITLEAKGRVFIHSSDDEVEILGGPWVKINCGPVKEGESDTVTMHHVTGVVRDQDGKPLKDCTVVVKASDGAVQQVQTDGGGKYFALVPPGKCEVSLPGGKRYGVKGVNLDTMSEEPVVMGDGGPALQ